MTYILFLVYSSEQIPLVKTQVTARKTRNPMTIAYSTVIIFIFILKLEFSKNITFRECMTFKCQSTCSLFNASRAKICLKLKLKQKVSSILKILSHKAFSSHYWNISLMYYLSFCCTGVLFPLFESSLFLTACFCLALLIFLGHRRLFVSTIHHRKLNVKWLITRGLTICSYCKQIPKSVYEVII